MIDAQREVPSVNNIRTLVYFLSVILDRRIAQTRNASPYAPTRDSDTRVFLAAVRATRTISDIARNLHVSRQSAQSSVGRLVGLKLVKLANHPTSKREKLVVITEQGWQAASFAAAEIGFIETRLAGLIGNENYAIMKSGLEKLVDGGAEALKQG